MATIDYLFSRVSTLIGTCRSAVVSHCCTSWGSSIKVTQRSPIASVNITATSLSGTSSSAVKYVYIIVPLFVLKKFHICCLFIVIGDEGSSGVLLLNSSFSRSLSSSLMKRLYSLAASWLSSPTELRTIVTKLSSWEHEKKILRLYRRYRMLSPKKSFTRSGERWQFSRVASTYTVCENMKFKASRNNESCSAWPENYFRQYSTV